MAFAPIPKQPTANKNELLLSVNRSFQFYLQEKKNLTLDESKYKLQHMNEIELLQTCNDFIQAYHEDVTFYIRRSLQVCYAKDRAVGVTDEETRQFIQDLRNVIQEN